MRKRGLATACPGCVRHFHSLSKPSEQTEASTLSATPVLATAWVILTRPGDGTRNTYLKHRYWHCISRWLSSWCCMSSQARMDSDQ